MGIWCISDQMSGEKYGSVFLLPLPIEERDSDYSLVIPGQIPDGDVEIGYALKRSAWGEGYATEACKRLLKFEFQYSRLNERVATFDDGNVASIKVLEKSGLTDRGRMWCYGEDSPNYRITRDEWLESQQPP